MSKSFYFSSEINNAVTFFRLFTGHASRQRYLSSIDCGSVRRAVSQLAQLADVIGPCRCLLFKSSLRHFFIKIMFYCKLLKRWKNWNSLVVTNYPGRSGIPKPIFQITYNTKVMEKCLKIKVQWCEVETTLNCLLSKLTLPSKIIVEKSYQINPSRLRYTVLMNKKKIWV